MTAYLYRMPVGIAGAISRPQDLTVEPVVLKSDNAFAAYGLAGKYDADGFFVPLADGDTADKVKGIYVRPYMYLSDETYRVILKAKIAINNWDGRNDSLPAILDAATAGSGLRMQIVDNQDMTISVWVFPDTDISDVSRELIAAIKQGYLTVKAAGVWAGGIETPSVETPSEGSKFFGFDMDNEFISGFDVGAWGVLL